jgi:putative transposase
MSVARSSLRYASKRAAADGAALGAMRELAQQYPRYGYRRVRVFLRRAGHPMSSKDRAHSLWRLAGLQVPRKPRQ